MRTNVTLTLDDDLIFKARRRAAREGTTVSDLVRDFLAQYGQGDDGSPNHGTGNGLPADGQAPAASGGDSNEAGGDADGAAGDGGD